MSTPPGRKKAGGRKKRVYTPKPKPQTVVRLKSVREIPVPPKEKAYYYNEYNTNKPEIISRVNNNEPNAWVVKELNFCVVLEKGGKRNILQYNVPHDSRLGRALLKLG